MVDAGRTAGGSGPKRTFGRITTRQWRSAVITLLLVLAGSLLTACEPVKPIVFIYGDSLTVEAESSLRAQLDGTYDVRVAAAGGTALCDYMGSIVEDARNLRPRMTVMAFSGNTLTPCALPPAGTPNDTAWIARKYAADAASIISQLGALGVPMTFVGGPPVLVKTADPVIRPAQWAVGQVPTNTSSADSPVANAYRTAVAQGRARGIDVGYIDGGRFLRAPSGGWTKVLPCAAFDPRSACVNGLVHIRSNDLGHFCPGSWYTLDGVWQPCDTWSGGAYRYANAIAGYAANRIGTDATGSLDAVWSPAPNRLGVSGWALDPDADEAPVAVHIYVDGVVHPVLADRYRPDLATAFPWSGPNHAFDVVLPATPGPHEVCAYVINVGANSGANWRFGCRSVVVRDGTPIGTVDWAVADNGSATVAGWTFDPDRPTTPLAVHVYVDGRLTTAVGADASRPDVGAAFPGTGTNHGYIATFPIGSGTHTVCAYAINIGEGSGNPQLGCATVSWSDRPPVGVVDWVVGSRGSATVAGWTFDPDRPTTPLAVHVYVDGRFTTAVGADASRPDVGAAFPGTGTNHGYIATFPIGSGTHTVCAYAINIGDAAGNPQLGCRAVTV